MIDFSYLICPNCETQMETLTPLQGGDKFKPGVGNILLCANCGQPSLVDTIDKQVIPLSIENLKTIEEINPELFRKLVSYIMQTGPQ